MQGGKWSPMQAVAYIQDSISCSRFVVNYKFDEGGQAKSAINAGWEGDYEKLTFYTIPPRGTGVKESAAYRYARINL